MAREKSMVVKTSEGKTFRWGGKEHTVKPACGGERGKWMCLTHMIAFISQPQKDDHVKKGQHEIVWLCAEHGAEVP
jgi:hypothetical protein